MRLLPEMSPTRYWSSLHGGWRSLERPYCLHHEYQRKVVATLLKTACSIKYEKLENTTRTGEREEKCVSSPPGNGARGFIEGAGFAILNGQGYLFGGNTDYQKIATLDGCTFNPTPYRLLSKFESTYGSLLTINNKGL